MQEMNYGCGTTVHPAELSGEPTVLYVGVGEGVDVGFGQVEIRACRPYRLLDAQNYGLETPLLLESLDSVLFKVPIPSDGVCIFTGKTAIYSGAEEALNDRAEHIMLRGIPLAVCDKTAGNLSAKFPAEIMVTDSTWHYDGGGCC